MVRDGGKRARDAVAAQPAQAAGDGEGAHTQWASVVPWSCAECVGECVGEGAARKGRLVQRVSDGGSQARPLVSSMEEEAVRQTTPSSRDEIWLAMPLGIGEGVALERGGCATAPLEQGRAPYAPCATHPALRTPPYAPEGDAGIAILHIDLLIRFGCHHDVHLAGDCHLPP